MTDKLSNKPPARSDRRDRLAAALRANLRKRKAQARARREAENEVPDESGSEG